jgi:hypothetical protein
MIYRNRRGEIVEKKYNHDFYNSDLDNREDESEEEDEL